MLRLTIWRISKKSINTLYPSGLSGLYPTSGFPGLGSCTRKTSTWNFWLKINRAHENHRTIGNEDSTLKGLHAKLVTKGPSTKKQKQKKNSLWKTQIICEGESLADLEASNRGAKVCLDSFRGQNTESSHFFYRPPLPCWHWQMPFLHSHSKLPTVAGKQHPPPH